MSVSSEKGSSTRPVKVTVVGDGTVGKTCLLIAYTQNSFPTEYVPTVFDNFCKNVTHNGVKYSLTLWDTAGQEEYEKLRPLSYPKTDCFVVCYAVDNRSSFENIEQKWIPELRHYCPKAKILLVGTKEDVIESENPKQMVTIAEAKRLKSKIKASAHLQCSAKTQRGVEEVFQAALKAISNNKKPLCAIL